MRIVAGDGPGTPSRRCTVSDSPALGSAAGGLVAPLALTRDAIAVPVHLGTWTMTDEVHRFFAGPHFGTVGSAIARKGASVGFRRPRHLRHGEHRLASVRVGPADRVPAGGDGGADQQKPHHRFARPGAIQEACSLCDRLAKRRAPSLHLNGPVRAECLPQELERQTPGTRLRRLWSEGGAAPFPECATEHWPPAMKGQGLVSKQHCATRSS